MSRERRVHARIAVALNARVLVGSEEIQLDVRDVSRGGIFLYSKSPLGKVGEVFKLRLALVADIKPVLIEAKLVRVVKDSSRPGGEILGLGMHFVNVSAEQERALVHLLDRSMKGPGTMNRAYPRIYFLLEVACRSKSDFKALMQDIGEGGIGLAVDRQFQRDEEITVEISRQGTTPLKLSGWVTSSEPFPGRPGEFRIGVRFARLGAARGELLALIEKLYRG